MDTALAILEELTCTYLKAETAERVFESRDGFSTVFTDPFSEITSVIVDGEEVEYSKMFWNRKNSDVFNSVVLDHKIGNKEVTINATWVIPADLQALADSLATLIGSNKTSTVKSKKIEDFSVTYSDSTLIEQFALDNQAVLSRYSLCSVSNVRNGSLCRYYDESI